MYEYKLRDSEYKIRYFDFQADKTPILFIHGLGCAGSFDYVEVACQNVLSSYRSIIVDLLGAGYSDKPENFIYSVKSHAKYLNEFIEDMDIKELIVYGHSLGGAIAIELCALCGNKVKKLILNEPNFRPSRQGSASWDIAHLNGGNLEFEMKLKIEQYENEGNTMWASTLRNWLPKATYDISKDAAYGDASLWEEDMFSLTCPKCFIFGENSLPDEDYDMLKLKNETTKIVNSAGHSMAWENPQDLAITIKECINK